MPTEATRLLLLGAVINEACVAAIKDFSSGLNGCKGAATISASALAFVYLWKEKPENSET